LAVTATKKQVYHGKNHGAQLAAFIIFIDAAGT